MKHTLFSLLLLSNIAAFGQNTQIDNLKSAIGYAKDDSLKVQLLLELANECRHYAPHEVREYNMLALQLAEKQHFTLEEGLALRGLGKYFYNLGNYDSAMRYYTLAELAFRRIDHNLEISNIRADFCYVCIAKGEYNKALLEGISALQLAEETGDEEILQNAHAFIGFTHLSSGSIENAIEYLLKGIEIAERRKDIKGLAFLKRDMAVCFDKSGDFNNAIIYYNESAELFRKLNDRYSQGLALFCVAEVYRCKNDLSNALNSFYECYLITSEMFDEDGKIQVALKLSKTYIQIYTQGKSVVTANRLIRKLGFVDINELLTSIYNQLTTNNNRNYLRECLVLLVDLNLYNKEYKQAYKYNTDLIDLNKTLAQINTTNILAELLNRFEIQQMEKELELIEARTRANDEQITVQRQQQLIIVILTVLLIILGFMLRSRIRTVRRIKDALQEENKQFAKEKARAENSEKFKEQFLTKVSHEIRTPMNAIMGITNILIKNEHLPEQETYLDAINISSRHLLGLINDILDLSKLEAGKYEFEKIPFGVGEIFERIKKELSPSAKLKKNSFLFHFDNYIPSHLIGDQYMLHQTLHNLCRNAIEYTKVGRIDVACKLVGKTEKVAILGFSVKDTGVGIDKELHDKIFSSFIGEISFDKKSFNQSGLELLIIRQMLESQGGKITIDSEPGLGTTFYFEIPYEINIGNKKAVDKIQKKVVKSKQTVGIKILLVEDNEFNVMVAQEELKDGLEEVTVDVAGNGQIALEMIAHNDYDIVLMDIQMPVMNGYDATKAIRNMDGPKNEIPIIAMTANIMKSEVDKCFEAGMNAYIPKPFQRDELLHRIRENLSS